MTKYIVKLVFLTAIFQFITWNSLAQVSTNLQQTTFDTCGESLPTAELNLGDLVISESLASDFSAGTYTFFIAAPSNFEINATSVVTTGTDISNATVTQVSGDATKLEITLNVTAQASIDELTLENVRIQLISGATTDGIVSYDLGGNANNLNGLTDADTMATLTFNELFGGTGVNQQLCALTDVQNISVTGDTVTQSRTYAWEKRENGNWTPIANSNTEELAVSNANVVNGENRYRRTTTFTINGETCVLTSTAAIITVNEIYPGSITEGGGQNICASETPDQLSTAADVAVTVGGTRTYQWYKNDSNAWVLINGANNTFYQPGALTTTTSFKRRITNVFNGLTCFEETPPVTITVNSAVAGGTAVDQDICTLSDLQVLTITNGNNNGTYQWQKNISGTWTDIANATGINYDASGNLSPGIELFRRVTTVSGANCVGISTVATISYSNFSKGSITGIQTICNGETPNLFTSTANANGTGNISYQWQRFDGANWATIAGEVATSFQSGPLQQTTRFRRMDAIELNGFTCAEPTNEITVTVNSTVIGGTTTDQNICTLSELQLLTVNNGNNNGTYQWQKNVSNIWTDIQNATGINFDASTDVSPGINEYRRVTTVSGANCQGISTVATITYSNFQVGTISGAQTLCYNETATTLNSDTNASGTGTISYQWQQLNGNNWIDITNAVGTTYAPGSLTQTTSFRRLDAIELNGFTCSETTNEITVQVLPEILGGSASANQTICIDEIPTTITVTNGTTTGSNLSYQWQSKTSGNFTNMVGETDADLSFAAAPATTTTYRRQTIISNNLKVCEAFSSESIVFVNTITAGVIGNNQNVCAGETPSTLISAVNTAAAGTVTYAWESSTDGGTTFTGISNASGATYTPGVLATTTRFRRLDSSLLNGKTCTAYTNAVAITVAGAIAGGDGSINQTVCEGEIPGTISVANGTPAGTGITFQWYSSTDANNYTMLAGESGENLFFSSGISVSTFYRREVTLTNGNTNCTANSTPVLVTLLSLAEGSIGQTQTVCGGFSVPPLTSTADAVSNGAITYSWQDSPDGITWSAIANANQSTYTPPITDDLQTYFRRRATATLQGTTCEVFTEPVIVYVNRFEDGPNHRIRFSANDASTTKEVCNQEDPGPLAVNFDLIASGTLSYQWQVSSNNINFSTISGATNASYDPPAVTVDVYYRRVTTTTLNGVACTITSNVLEFINAGNATAGTIGTTNVVSTNTSVEVICRNTVPSPMEELTPASSGGGGTLTYQWFANGTPLTGATGIDFAPTNAIVETTLFVRRTYSTNVGGNTCEVNSNGIIVLVPQGDEIGEDITLCTGETPPTLGDVSLIEGPSYLTYQWYDSPDGSTFSEISGATNATYSPNSALTTDRYYRRGYIATVEGNDL